MRLLLFGIVVLLASPLILLGFLANTIYTFIKIGWNLGEWKFYPWLLDED